MSFFRAHKLHVALALVLFLSVIFSLYSIWKYPGDSSSGGAGMPGFRQGEGFTRQGASRPDGPSQTAPPGGSTDNTAKRTMPSGSAPFAGSVRSSWQYATPLALFAALGFGLTAVLFNRVARKKSQIHETDATSLMWMLLGIGLFLRVAAAPWIPGFVSDIGLFKSWATSAANNLSGFYLHGSSDYPPLYIYVLYLAGKLAALPQLSGYFTLLIKLPSILADVMTAYLLYRVASKHLSAELGLLVASFYTFNPAVFINSTFWGQVDSFFALLVVAAMHFLSEEKLGWSTAFLTAAVLMKPQGIIYLPILCFSLLRVKRVRAWFTVIASALVTGLLVVLPFSVGQGPLWLFKLYTSTVNEYPYASVNAFNFFGLLGANYVRDSTTLLAFSYKTWGLVFIVAVTAFSWWMYTKARRAEFASAVALMQIAGVFTFESSMHERYLFPAVALALLAYVQLKENKFLWLALGFSVTTFANTYAILYRTANGVAPFDILFVTTSLLNVLLCAFLAKVLWERSHQGSEGSKERWTVPHGGETG